MLENKFKIKLTMLSDWQIGTGAGIPGSTDELISKDADGFPQVPAKTLVGIWRDAMERLCDGLGGNRSNWVETIFGAQPNRIDKDELEKRLKNSEPTYSNSILSIQPARISKNLRAKIGDDKRLKQALTFTKVGVKINPDSGTSETDMLRFEEMGRIDTVLEAEAECEKMNETISALLILSAKMVERIGGKRRRGAGKCKFEIVGIGKNEINDAVDTIRDNKTSADRFVENSKMDSDGNKTEETSEWQTCEYTLTLETPVSIVTAVLGNVSETLDFVPGTYLIGHFVKHCGQKIFKAIQDGDFQILPATICIDGAHSFPVPKVFAREKMNKDKVYNLLIDKRTPETPQTKPIREGFYAEKDGEILHATTPLVLQMHNAVDDDFQRPTSDVIGIYSREAIRAGTILKGEIRYRNSDISLEKLNGKDGNGLRVRLGTSKKDSGSARLRVESVKKDKAENDENERTFDKKLVVYLASDAMLRNENLRQTNLFEDLKNKLQEKLKNVTLKSLDELVQEAKQKLKNNPDDETAKKYIEDQSKFITSIISVRRIESWQTSWGFPRPTLTLMQAGSVVVFEIQDFEHFSEDEKSSIKKTLEDLEKEGIGERRGEGYGQIIFNPPILDKKGVLQTGDNEKLKLIWKNSEAKKVENLIADGDIEDKKFAELIEKTAWQEELKIAVSKIAADETKREEFFGFNGLNMSQIGGLRSAIMRLRSRTEDEKNQTRKIVVDWLEHLEKTPNRKEKWKDKRINKAKDILKNNAIWDKLNGFFNKPKSLGLEHNLKEELWAEAVKSLFYACQQAHKRDTEKDKKEDENNGSTN